jgi:hypothetical protein
MPQRDIDLLMGMAFFLVGALAAVLAKAYLVALDNETTIYVFGPSEPEITAREARLAKRIAETEPRDPDDE